MRGVTKERDTDESTSSPSTCSLVPSPEAGGYCAPASAVDPAWHLVGTQRALGGRWLSPVDGRLCLTGFLGAGSICSVAAEPRGRSGSCSERAKEMGSKPGGCGF